MQATAPLLRLRLRVHCRPAVITRLPQALLGPSRQCAGSPRALQSLRSLLGSLGGGGPAAPDSEDERRLAVLRQYLSPARVHDVVNPRLAGAPAPAALAARPAGGAGGAAAGELAAPSWVSDAGHLLGDTERAEVDALCEQVYAAWKVEVAVVVLDALPEDVRPTAFGAALLNYWGVGDTRLRTGLVMMLLLSQRRLEMRVGYGAERILRPEVLKAVQDERMVPQLKAGNPGAALREGLRGVLEVLEAKGPPHWRRHPGDPPPERNRHGFGGGQTPIDAWLPPAEGRAGSGPAAAAAAI